MSRRKRTPAGAPAPGGGEPRGQGRSGAPAAGLGRAAARGEATGGGPEAGRRTWRLIGVDVGVLIGVFAVTAAVAELAGAANLGVALGIGQVAFALALVVVLLRD
jgi:hypothetical protein